MKALFLDIDGVIQSPNDQNRYMTLPQSITIGSLLWWSVCVASLTLRVQK